MNPKSLNQYSSQQALASPDKLGKRKSSAKKSKEATPGSKLHSSSKKGGDHAVKTSSRTTGTGAAWLAGVGASDRRAYLKRGKAEKPEAGDSPPVHNSAKNRNANAHKFESTSSAVLRKSASKK